MNAVALSPENSMSSFVRSILTPFSSIGALINGHHVVVPPSIVVPPLVTDLHGDEIAVISHEMRNALGVVRNAARLLRMPASAASVDGARVLIERQVSQLSRHIEDLLEVSQRTSGKKALRRSLIDLRTIAEFAVSGIASDLARRGHRMAVNLPTEPIWVHADAARMEQVFANLLVNASKYTPDGGDIVLTMERLDSRVSISIRDSGIGIEPAVLLRVFDMFAQADATAPSAEGGSGIGLAVVRDLVEMHGGIVRAASAGLGLGSEFTVLLPALWPHTELLPPVMMRID